MEDPRIETAAKGFRRRPIILDYVGAGNLNEDEAKEIAREVVRNARSGFERLTEGQAPDPEEVVDHREARDRNE